MLKHISSIGIRFPKLVLVISLMLTVFFASQLSSLKWETDARVYLPKGHAAIKYDERVDELFGVKDSLIITIVNEEEGVFNLETLARIARITDKVSKLNGVIANDPIDVASISTATYFYGTEKAIGTKPVMEGVPSTQADIELLKKRLYDNADLFVGNIISQDGKAAMIRARIKEGGAYRWMSYFQIKGILAAESGEETSWGAWGGESSSDGKWQGNDWVNADGTPKDKSESKDDEEPWQGNEWVNADGTPKEKLLEKKATDDGEAWEGNQWVNADGTTKKSIPEKNMNVVTEDFSSLENLSEASTEQVWKGNEWVDVDGSIKPEGKTIEPTAANNVTKAINDKFYLAGRPVIEVSSGMYAMDDMKIMVPMIVVVIAIILFLVFRTGRGVVLPLLVMVSAIIWTFGVMVLFGVPLYTISTMLPVILVAVGIGDAVHILSNYYDKVLHNPQADRKEIVANTMADLKLPLITTSVTTGIGFLALIFAEMPPFKIFGLFAMLGVLLSWLISILLMPAILCLMKPKVGAYYARKRNQRMFNSPSRLSWLLSRLGQWIYDNHKGVALGFMVIMVVAVVGSTRLFVDSSWLSDFKEGSEVDQSTKIINEYFDGSIFLNVVIESEEKDIFKQPALLTKMQDLQAFGETLPYVGDSLSVVDYLKNMNMNLHAGDMHYNQLPDNFAQIAEYLFLFSVSGRPQQLDEVVDFEYRRGIIRFAIKTDHTRDLKHIIDQVNNYVDMNFKDLNVEVNLSGSANNSFIWAQLLIGSQTTAILLSKIGILLIASLLFLSLIAGIYVVVPVTVSTVLVAGVAGWFAIPLDVSTALAAGIAIGVGVDYAVHFIFRFKSELASGLDHQQALRQTMSTTGRTIVLNALVVGVGFTVLLFSQFPPHVKLGYFVAAYMAVSCLAACVVLPLLLSFFKPKFAVAKNV
ncbi:MAG: MMPL family transporter [Gammaproteobacteria bacterium]|nr:MMPL family transporter [Gammaproteobacteria bacterium]